MRNYVIGKDTPLEHIRRFPYKACPFCDHCSDLFWDSDGIYVILCDLNKHNDTDFDGNASGKCKDYFESEVMNIE